MRILFTYILLLSCLTYQSCDNSSNCCTIIEVDTAILYTSPSGENLIGTEYLPEDIKLYFKNGSEYEYIFRSNLNHPRMNYVREDQDSNKILVVFPSDYYEGDYSTTLIELNENVTDTLYCRFELTDNSEILQEAWLNGELMVDGYIEIVR